jgi:uncharacterized membrane protein
MISVEVSTMINRPIDEVFAFVSNFENHPQWARAISACSKCRVSG